MRWLRWLFVTGAVSILGVLLAAYWWYQRRIEREPPPPVLREADVFENFQDERLRDGRPVFRFRARRYRLQAGSVVEGQDVRIEIPSEGDAVAEVTAQTGQWYPTENRAVLTGQVRIRWRGLEVQTDRLTYVVDTAVAQAETPVRWDWPERRWGGKAQQGRYDMRGGVVDLEGDVRMTTDTGDAQYRLETASVRMDLSGGAVEFPRPVHVVSLSGPPLDFRCGRLRRDLDPDGTQVWSGQDACEGTFRRGDHVVKWQADGLTGWLQAGGRRWVWANGQFNLDDRWWVFGRRLRLTETPGRGPTMEAEEGRLRVEPLPASPFYGRFRFMEVDRLVWPSAETLDRLQVPGAFTVHMDEGRLEARDGIYDGKGWRARAPELRRDDGWQVTADTMAHDGTVLVLAGSEATPVQGTGVDRGKEWHIRARRAELRPDGTMRWLEAVEVRSPDFWLQTDRWERRAEVWHAEPVRQGRWWQKTEDRLYEVTFQAQRAEAGGTNCVRLEGDVRLEFRTAERPDALAVQARQGEFCRLTWRLEGDFRFHYRDVTGTGTGGRVDWSGERVYVEGPVRLQDTGGWQAQAREMVVDMKADRVELTNPAPHRGIVTWPRSGRP